MRLFATAKTPVRNGTRREGVGKHRETAGSKLIFADFGLHPYPAPFGTPSRPKTQATAERNLAPKYTGGRLDLITE